MTTTVPIDSPDTPANGRLHRVRFVPQGAAGEALLEFHDPARCKAVCVGSGTTEGDGIDILTVPGQPGDPLEGDDHLTAWVAAGMPTAGPPITLTLHGAQVTWAPARAAILTSPERTTPYLLALVDFCHFENEL